MHFPKAHASAKIKHVLLLDVQDENGDGYLSFDEVRQALEKDSGGQDAGALRAAKAVMQALDVSGDGFIEYHEFLAAAIDRQRILTDHTLAELFGIPFYSPSPSSESRKQNLGGFCLFKVSSPGP